MYKNNIYKALKDLMHCMHEFDFAALRTGLYFEIGMAFNLSEDKIAKLDDDNLLCECIEKISSKYIHEKYVEFDNTPRVYLDIDDKIMNCPTLAIISIYGRVFEIYQHKAVTAVLKKTNENSNKKLAVIFMEHMNILNHTNNCYSPMIQNVYLG